MWILLISIGEFACAEEDSWSNKDDGSVLSDSALVLSKTEHNKNVKRPFNTPNYPF